MRHRPFLIGTGFVGAVAVALLVQRFAGSIPAPVLTPVRLGNVISVNVPEAGQMDFPLETFNVPLGANFRLLEAKPLFLDGNFRPEAYEATAKFIGSNSWIDVPRHQPRRCRSDEPSYLKDRYAPVENFLVNHVGGVQITARIDLSKVGSLHARVVGIIVRYRSNGRIQEVRSNSVAFLISQGEGPCKNPQGFEEGEMSRHEFLSRRRGLTRTELKQHVGLSDVPHVEYAPFP